MQYKCHSSKNEWKKDAQCVCVCVCVCVYTHTMTNYSAKKKKEILLFATTWMDLDRGYFA